MIWRFVSFSPWLLFIPREVPLPLPAPGVLRGINFPWQREGGKQGKKSRNCSARPHGSEGGRAAPGPGFGKGFLASRAAGSASRATQCPGAARQCQLHKSQIPRPGALGDAPAPSRFVLRRSPARSVPTACRAPGARGCPGTATGGGIGAPAVPGAGSAHREFRLPPSAAPEKPPRKKRRDEPREKSPEARGAPTSASLPSLPQGNPSEKEVAPSAPTGILPRGPAAAARSRVLFPNSARTATPRNFWEAPEPAVHGNVKLWNGSNSLKRK